MKPLLPAIAALALSACNQAAPALGPEASEAAEAPVATAEPASPKAITAPTPSPSVEVLSAPTLVLEQEKGKKGARNILIEWARAIERQDFARADAQWGAADAKSAKQFADYASIIVGFGDGDVEGAAGSLIYEVPLSITGKRRDGTAIDRKGTVTLRRVNDVDGATPAQLRWHLAGVTLTD